MVVWLSLWVLYTGSAVDLQPQHWKHTHRHQNIHYDTGKRYNNYTEKEITELKQHHQVFVSDRVRPRVLSSSTNVAGASSSANPRQALLPEDQEFHPPPCCRIGQTQLSLLKEPPESFTIVDRRPLWKAKKKKQHKPEGHVLICSSRSSKSCKNSIKRIEPGHKVKVTGRSSDKRHKKEAASVFKWNRKRSTAGAAPVISS